MAGLPMPVETGEQRESEQKRASLTQVMDWAAEHFQRQLKGVQGRDARDYLARREISPAAQAHFRIGYAPPDRHGLRDALAAKGVGVEAMIEAGLLINGEDIAVPYDRFRHRLMFPIHDRGGAVIAFGGRALEKDARPDGHPIAKYLNSPETPLFHKGATLYNLHNARKAAHEAGTVIAVEGYIDVIAMTAAGLAHVVAPLGTALTPEQCALLWRMAEEPILCFDGDKAGLKAAFRAIDTALPLIGPGRTLRFVLLPGGQDPDELLRSGGAGALEQAMSAPLPLIEMLWRRETQERPLDTPERRASLERRLAEVAGQIQDAALRRYYGQDLSTRLSKLFSDEFSHAGAQGGRQRKIFGQTRFGARFGGSSARPGVASGPVRVGAALANSPLFKGVKPQVSARECLILLVLINHPPLLADHIEDLAAMYFEAREANALRDLMVRSASSQADGEAASTQALSQLIEEAGLAPFHARLEGMVAHANLWSVQPEAATADAAATLRQALSLHHKVWALNKELRMIEGRLAVDPNEDDAARLADIQTQLSTLDGTEAALEGFGAMSGRANRVL